MLDNVPVIKPERVDNKTGDDDAMVSDPFYTPVLFCFVLKIVILFWDPILVPCFHGDWS